MIRPIKRKKGQAEGIIVFFALAVAILIVSIIILRIVNSVLTPFAPIIGNMSAPAGATVTAVQHSFGTWWDYFIILLLCLNVFTLLVSSFMVDIHPAFVIVYILAILVLVVMGNFALGALDQVWFHVGRNSIEGPQTQLQQFVINHFQMLLWGIIMYAKIKFFSGMGGNYG
jgi:hypothetical protein